MVTCEVAAGTVILCPGTAHCQPTNTRHVLHITICGLQDTED